jgi:hypothetical protein
MTRLRSMLVLTAVAVIASTYSLRADVRADEKSRVEFAGMLGRMVNLFGGKGAKEGTVSTVAVKGDRKATLNDSTGTIIDLAEEKIYDHDMKKKTYKVTTFAELRRRMEEAKKKAEQDAQKEQAKEKEKAAEPAPPPENNVEIDFDVKNTGQKKVVNGFDAHQVVMTITVREKGKTLEQNGGLVLTADSWMALPKIAAMKEVTDFDMRYAQKLYGPMIAGASPQDMAAAAAMYPMMAPAIAKMRTEGVKLDGTPVMTVLTFDAVQSAEQAAAEQKPQGDSKSPGGLGGIAGGLMRRATQKKAEKSEGDQSQKGRTRVMTSTTEVLKVVSDVAATDVAVPAGFKENR